MVTRSITEFERAAREEASSPDNANRELIFFYADVAGRPGDALRLAEKEVERRRDVRSLDAHAWALYRSGRAQEARAVIEQALAVGMKEAPLLHRAGEIAVAAGDTAAAHRYWTESLRIDGASEVAEETKRRLAPAAGA